MSEVNLRIIEKQMVPSTSDWESVPMTIYQDVSQKKILKVEVLGDNGKLFLYPDTDNYLRFKTLPGVPEKTVIDFNNWSYSCPLGMSTFRLVDLE